MSGADPVRAKLLRALADAEARVAAAVNGIVRVLHGCGWNDDRTRAHRQALAMATAEVDALKRSIVVLDEIDAEATR